MDKIRNYLANIAAETYKDKTIVKLLHEYAVRVEKERKCLKRDMLLVSRNHDIDYKITGSILYDTNPIKTVIAMLLIDERYNEYE